MGGIDSFAGRRETIGPRMKRVLFGLLLFLTSVHCATCIDNSVHPEAIKHHDVGIEYLNNGQCV